MPAPAPVYVERLGIRARWWAVVLTIAVFGSAELFAGFSAGIAAIVLSAVLVPTVLLLASASRWVLRVDAEGLHVRHATIRWAEVESLAALDARATRLQLGPDADPAARLLVRGYIAESVLVRPLDERGIPYWLVSTRHPERVIAAVEQATRASLGR